MSLKQKLLEVLTLPGVTRPFAPLMRGRASIFMLHRFADPANGIAGRDPGSVRRVLEYLRRERYEIVSLGELFERLAGHGPPADRTVCFTQDDGTLDQATVAAPLFAEFDAPVTTFVVTDYLDGKLWLWWDQIEHLFEHTARRSVDVTLGGKALRFGWENPGERARAQEDFTQRCKRVPDPEKHAAIARLAAALEVPLPDKPPQRYAPMTWDQLRACEAKGMSFGSHTVTHPILSMTDDAQSERELTVAWERVRAEAKDPVPIFCYPNGLPEDFGPREVRTLTRLGFRGAVTALPQRYARVSEFRSDGASPFSVPRLDFSERLPYVVQSVSGLRVVKEALRDGVRTVRGLAAS